MYESVRRYRIRVPFGLVLALVFPVAAAVASSRASTPPFQAHRSRVASVWATRSVLVGDSARRSLVGPRRVSIARYTATPAALSASGGKVRLQALVHAATKCRFSSTTTLKGLPSTKGCTSGRASVSITLPNNTTTSTKTYDFHLTARGAGGTSTRRVIVVEHAATRAVVGPVITMRAPESSQFLSGYEAYGASFSAVSASWTVPTLTCPPGGANTFVAEWSGIGDSTSVVQDGTSGGCSLTSIYSAWYELLGDSNVNGGFMVELNPSQYPVAPGDVMTSAISISGSTWTLKLTDATRPWSFTFSTPNTSPGLNQESAEVVVENQASGGTEGLSNFGAIDFTGATADLDGQAGPISAFHPIALDMTNSPAVSGTTNGYTIRAAPGPLDPTGEDFTETWYAN
jgi:hypothetical protein